MFARDLEKAVEDLSELLESPIEADNIPGLRQKMTDKTVRTFNPQGADSLYSHRLRCFPGLRAEAE